MISIPRIPFQSATTTTRGGPPRELTSEKDNSVAFEYEESDGDAPFEYFSYLWQGEWEFNLDGLEEARAVVCRDSRGILACLEISWQGGDTEDLGREIRAPSFNEARQSACGMLDEWRASLFERSSLAEPVQERARERER